MSIVALLISVFSLLVSAITLWLSRLLPYQLLILPPAISQVNDEAPSLLMDLSINNFGAKEAVISDIVVHLFCDSEKLQLTLSVQHIVERFGKTDAFGMLQKDTKRSLFVPLVVKGHDMLAERLYLAPFASPEKWSLDEILRTNKIQIDLQVNGSWKQAVFVLQYSDFSDKFTSTHLVVPEKGYAPRWYRDLPPVMVDGSIIAQAIRRAILSGSNIYRRKS
jgi:hypothetical protein